MAGTTIKVEGSQKAGNVFNVPPESIKYTELNLGRHFDHDADSIDEMVRSYEERGQDTPIRARKNGKDLVLTYGRRRLLAAIKYNELHPKKPMLLAVVVDDDNEEAAFERAVDENMVHKGVSVVDLAFMMKTYREKYKWQDKDIAKRFNTNATKVSHCKKLTTLRDSILLMVHKGELSFDTAVELAGYNDTTQDEILEWARAYKEEQKNLYEERLNSKMADCKKIDGELPPEPTPETPKPKAKPQKTKPPTTDKAVTESIRKKQSEAAEKNKAAGSPARPQKIKPPTFAELKTFITQEFLEIRNPPEPASTLFSILFEYMTGETTDKNCVKDIKAECKKFKMIEQDAA